MKTIVCTFILLLIIGSSCGKKKYSCECVEIGSATTIKTGKGRTPEAACEDAARKVLGVPQEVCTPL